MWRGGEINTRLIPGYTTGHRSPAAPIRLTELDIEERARLQVLPFNKATSIISSPAVIGNINCVVYTHLLSTTPTQILKQMILEIKTSPRLSLI